MKRELERTDAGDGSADSTVCSEMTTNLADVSLMLAMKSGKYDTTKALEVTEAITNVNAKDLQCSEQDVASLIGELDAAKDKASVVVTVETESAASVSEALANLCPASTTPTSTSTGRNI